MYVAYRPFPQDATQESRHRGAGGEQHGINGKPASRRFIDRKNNHAPMSAGAGLERPRRNGVIAPKSGKDHVNPSVALIYTNRGHRRVGDAGQRVRKGGIAAA